MMRALIVGHTGQDGSILWEQLVSSGFSVVGISRGVSRAHNIVWDEVTDISNHLAVMRLLKNVRPDRIFFLAAHHHSSQDHIKGELDIWDRSLSVHVQSFQNFLSCATLLCPKSRIFYASSSRIFGDATVSPQDERTPFKPVCIYGFTKATGMALAEYHRRVHRTYVSCGILYNHESPLRGEQYVSRRVIDGLVAIKHGEATSLQIGSLDAKVDWGYAPDYTRAMQLILEAESSGDFVIASGRMHSVRDMVRIAADYLDLSWEKYVVETSAILHRRPQELCGNSSYLREMTGWCPRVDFRSMVEKLIDASELKRSVKSISSH